jgi:uncharacterized protein YecE (DUF72 family)
MPLFVGTAGWSLPRAEQGEFAGTGSHLERYSQRFEGTEINSSFHRSHRESTWLRWRDSVPAHFRFSVKLPKTITHVNRLGASDVLLAAFLKEAILLEEKLGCLLVQLPPSLAFDHDVADRFFTMLCASVDVNVACEPRHESWFTRAADALLARHGVGRVAADPARAPAAGEPGGARRLSYYRLHGSPKMYYSSYDALFIAGIADRVRTDLKAGRTVWAIFDNTTLGAATRNALDLMNAVA